MNLKAQFSAAQRYRKTDKLAKAEPILKAIIQQNPDHAGAYHELGLVAWKSGHPQHALALIQHAAQLNPGSETFAVDLVNLHIELKDEASAQQSLTTAITNIPDSAQLRSLQSRFLRSEPSPGSSDASNSTQVQKLLLHANALLAREAMSELHVTARTILDQDPECGKAWFFMGVSMIPAGRYHEALQCLLNAIRITPEDAETLSQIGTVYMHLGNREESIAAHEHALRLKSNNPVYLINAAMGYQKVGNLDKAEELANAALAFHTRSLLAYTILGRIQRDRGDIDRSTHLFKIVLQKDPTFYPALRELGENLVLTGQFDEAEKTFRRALVKHPNEIETYAKLAECLTALKREEESIKICEMGLKKNADFLPLYVRMAQDYRGLRQYSKSIDVAKAALRIDENCPEALFTLGGTLSMTGQPDKAEREYQASLAGLEYQPKYISSQIFNLNYDPSTTAESLLEASNEFKARIESQVTPYTEWLCEKRADKILNIGVVSGDLRSHPVGYFLESVFEELSNQDCRLYLYPTVVSEDETSERLKSIAHAWTPVYMFNESQMAARIHHDQIDILIDVSGHTAHNRLAAFTFKPAPIQATWLGYLATSGLDAMDYIVGDPWVTPLEEENHFSEHILQLPETYQCLTPPEDAPDVGNLPALENGYITFGSCNNFAKLNDNVIALWAEIVRAVPESKLLLKTQVLEDSPFQSRIVQKFKARGVPRDRLILEPSQSREHILNAYNRIDIGLDPFPYTGCTTSFEALWMGVPIISMQGSRFLSHAGESILNNLGMPEWLAEDANEYLEIACARAAELGQLGETRAQLRNRILTSPLMNAERFAAHMYTGLRNVWERWCKEETTASIQATAGKA